MKKTIFKRILCVFFAVFILAALAISAAADGTRAIRQFCYPDFDYYTNALFYQDFVNGLSTFGGSSYSGLTRYFFGHSEDYNSLVTAQKQGLYTTCFGSDNIVYTASNEQTLQAEIDILSKFGGYSFYTYDLLLLVRLLPLQSDYTIVKIPISVSNISSFTLTFYGDVDKNLGSYDVINTNEVIKTKLHISFSSVQNFWEYGPDGYFYNDSRISSIDLFLYGEGTSSVNGPLHTIYGSNSELGLIGATLIPTSGSDLSSCFAYFSCMYTTGNDSIILYDPSSVSSGTSDPGNNSGSGSGESGSGESGSGTVTPADDPEELFASDGTLVNFVFAIFQAPMVLLSSMLDFTIFGINLYSVLKLLLTLSLTALLIAVIVKLILHFKS